MAEIVDKGDKRFIRTGDELKIKLEDKVAKLAVVYAAIDGSTKIPDGRKDAIKDFFTETVGELWEDLQDIASIAMDSIPPEVYEQWQNILEAINSLPF